MVQTVKDAKKELIRILSELENHSENENFELWIENDEGDCDMVDLKECQVHTGNNSIGLNTIFLKNW